MFAEQDIHRAVEVLREGGVVAFPTETVYGLGADALRDAAVAKVFELKGRPSTNPLIVHVAGPEMARTVVAADVPEASWTRADQLMRAFWPGPLSIILPRAACVPDRVVGIGGMRRADALSNEPAAQARASVTPAPVGVAVRCPDHPMTLALLRLFGTPLVGPSANRSGGVSPTTAEHVREAFASDDVFVLDGGPCRGGIESTVVSLLTDVPTVLRPGLVSAEDLSSAIGAPVNDAAEGRHAAADTGALASPGLLERHYAPRTRAILCKEGQWPEVVGGVGDVCVLISRFERPIHEPHGQIVLPMDARGYAAQLYAALRKADALGVAAIVIESPPTTSPLWRAIHDRLRRATTGE